MIGGRFSIFSPAAARRAVFILTGLLSTCLIAGLACGPCGSAMAASDSIPQDILQSRYQEFLGTASGSGSPPIEVRSLDSEKYLSAEVFGLLEQPFDELAETLLDPAEWCRFIPLHFNIKACTSRKLEDTALLTFYAGRKKYQSPDEAFRLRYDFEVRIREEDYFQVILRADEGPMGTRDYSMMLEAMAVEEGTFVRFRSSYRPSLRSRLATRGYLATLGRGKVGFTVVGHDEDGEPIYVKDVKGIIERNAVRYFLALKTYMIHRSQPPGERFERMLETWYRLNESYPVQLHEQEWEEYLRIKRRERENQQELQRRLEHDSFTRLPTRSSGSQVFQGN